MMVLWECSPIHIISNIRRLCNPLNRGLRATDYTLGIGALRRFYLNRRKFLAIASAAAAAALELPFAGGQDTPLLKSYGSRCDFRVGLQATRQNLQNQKFVDIIVPNFNLMTAGLELKWKRLRPRPDAMNFTDADFMIQFGEQRGMRIHGHNLCWNTANPGWFDTTLTRENAEKFLTEHVTAVVKRYGNRIDSWDVVNEPIDTRDGRSDGLKKGIWLDLLGPRYIDIAFQAAAAADPRPLRVLNIIEVEQDDPKADFSRSATLDLVKQLLSRHVPIQAIGLESHISATASSSPVGRNTFLKRLQDMGMQILVTENDVNDGFLPSETHSRDQKVAAAYQTYLESILSSTSCKQVIFWTPWDGDSWLNDPKYVRADHVPYRIGLWDTDFTPKPALAAVAAGLQKACR